MATAKPTTEIDLSGFGLERIQHIGRGQYATAQLVRETSSGSTYVAKCISMTALNEHDQDLAHQEVFLLQTLSHPYIVAYRTSFLVEELNTLVIVMEYCDAGDLRKFIKQKAKAREHILESQVMAWFVQLCLALQYIHSEKVLHRDLKTSNIFLAQGPTGSCIKLGDFGISRILEGTTEAAVTIVGTPYYMSPEVCRSEPYNWKSDVWAAGCVLYELCMLKHAFESSSLLGLVYKIVSDHYEPIPSIYSPQLNDLIRQLLMKNAEERPSINEVFMNPHVKAYLAQQSEAMSPPAELPADPAANAGQKNEEMSTGRRVVTLRPGGDRTKARPPAPKPEPPPPPPGPPQMGPQSRVLIIAARIRRRLMGHKLNWISSVASFDESGDGLLTTQAMANALMSMPLGLSEEEIVVLAESLAQASDTSGLVSLDAFSGLLQEVAPEVLQCEAWARQSLAQAGRRLWELPRARDIELRGTLAAPLFQQVLKELTPVLTQDQLDLLVTLADKNGLGDVDYAAFAEAFGPPLAPPSQPAPAMPPVAPAAPPGMPPLPGGPTPPGMPPLPGSPPPVQDLGGTINMGDIGFERTFFTCTSLSFQPGASTTGGHRGKLSPEGCQVIFARIRRRLDAVGLSINDLLALFTHTGERDLMAEQWLDVAATLPLGASRAEMQQLFAKMDADGSGRVPVETLQKGVSGASPAICSTAPSWISAAMSKGLCGQIMDALSGMGGSAGLARESDFRRVVMQTERYLTSDQLNALVLLADKSPDGHVDYEEFSQRFGGGGDGVLHVPGRALPSVAPLPPGGAEATEQEVVVVASRTGGVLERQGLAPERLPALVSLWGGGLGNDVTAALLASLPIGLSRQEATVQLQVCGSVQAFAARLAELIAQGVWRAQCEWAAANVPGPPIRAVLQRQLIEAESRTLEPAEFVRTLVEAGMPPQNAQAAVWLAEKTAQGDIRIGEFLSTFGGPQSTTQKKKRGMFWRIVGR